MAQKKSKVVSPPRPKRKPSVRGAAAEAPTEAAQEIIISGPSGLNNPKEMKADLDMWGVSPREYKNLKGSDLRKAWKSWHNIMESREGGKKVMKKKEGKVIYKRQGGMSRVGLSPAEEARSGTMSEAKREKYMQGGGPIHTTFPKRAHPRTEGRKTAVDLFPKVERKAGTMVTNGKREKVKVVRGRPLSLKGKHMPYRKGSQSAIRKALKRTMLPDESILGTRTGTPAERKKDAKKELARIRKLEAANQDTLFPSKKAGGKVLETKKKKKQGYKDRKDESIAQRVKKKRTKKQLKASRDESYGKWGKGKGKGKIRRITSKQTDGNKLVASLYD